MNVTRLATLALLLTACGDDPLPQPPDVPALLQPGQEVDPCGCAPKPYTTDGSLGDVNCEYGWKVILSCSDVCTNGAPQWRTVCGPIVP